MYPIPVRVNGQAVFVLWESDDDANDRVLADGSQVLRFLTLEALEGFATERGIEVEDGGELEPMNIDAAQGWVVGGPMLSFLRPPVLRQQPASNDPGGRAVHT